jgi:hypothetical protein
MGVTSSPTITFLNFDMAGIKSKKDRRGLFVLTQSFVGFDN